MKQIVDVEGRVEIFSIHKISDGNSTSLLLILQPYTVATLIFDIMSFVNVTEMLSDAERCYERRSAGKSVMK